MSEKVKLQIDIECWKDDMGNWRYTSNELSTLNGYCNRSLLKKIKKVIGKMIEEHSHCKGCGKPVYKRYQLHASDDYFPDYCEECEFETDNKKLFEKHSLIYHQNRIPEEPYNRLTNEEFIKYEEG